MLVPHNKTDIIFQKKETMEIKFVHSSIIISFFSIICKVSD